MGSVSGAKQVSNFKIKDVLADTNLGKAETAKYKATICKIVAFVTGITVIGGLIGLGLLAYYSNQAKKYSAKAEQERDSLIDKIRIGDDYFKLGNKIEIKEGESTDSFGEILPEEENEHEDDKVGRMLESLKNSSKLNKLDSVERETSLRLIMNSEETIQKVEAGLGLIRSFDTPEQAGVNVIDIDRKTISMTKHKNLTLFPEGESAKYQVTLCADLNTRKITVEHTKIG